MKKILLLHGWGYQNYNPTQKTDAWVNRVVFVEALRQHFDVIKINLPGFAGNPDPRIPWGLDDYVEYVNKVIEKEPPDFILGFSFGGAIAVRWKYLFPENKAKLILLSPAIIRKYKKTQSAPYPIPLFIKNIYMKVVVRNPFYTKASKVMRETYRNIVVKDLRKELVALPEKVLLIYGENDTATPPALIETSIAHHEVHILENGGHDIANSHTKELIDLIFFYTKNVV